MSGRMVRKLTAALAVLGAAVSSGAPAAAVAAPVSAYPSPGAATVSPQTGFSFRGVNAGSLGAIRVAGSRSGPHAGRLVPHPDGRGVSFVPDAPFAATEEVVVRTGAAISGAKRGDFRVRIARPGPPLRNPPLKKKESIPGRVRFYHSRRDLRPPAARVRRSSSRAAPGRLFVTPKLSRGQNGPLMLDQRGDVVWAHPLKAGFEANDFRVQRYRGAPVLTWWEGRGNLGTGNGEGVIYDRSYREVARVRTGNGYGMDPHEFLLTPRGTALVGSLSPVIKDLRKLGGPRRGVVFDTVVQEVDVATGVVLFEWHSLDHVGLRESYLQVKRLKGKPFDYFHINSIEPLRGGDLIVGARNTWGAYRIRRSTGALAWRLGGKRSSFRMGRGTRFAWQHDVRVLRDGTVTIFDDQAAPKVGPESRGLVLRLSRKPKRARLVRQFRHRPSLTSTSQGNLQRLPGGNTLIGWGALPRISEFGPGGRLLFELTLSGETNSYRAYKQPWTGLPADAPAIAASRTGGGPTKVYASWNGATEVARWRVLGGKSADALKPVVGRARRGFETLIEAKGAPAMVAVQALSGRGRVLATSPAVVPKRTKRSAD